MHLENYKKDIHWYLRELEETIILTIAEFGLTGTRDPEYTGVWVDDAKIAAIGIKVSRWVTMHGFALNVTTDLDYFGRIIPCGIFHKDVCSIQSLTGKAVSLKEVMEIYIEKFEQIFHCQVKPQQAEDSEELLIQT